MLQFGITFIGEWDYKLVNFQQIGVKYVEVKEWMFS
jgi:hypothetical protein